MKSDQSTESGSAIYLILVPAIALLCILVVSWIQYYPKIRARAVACVYEKDEAAVTVRCTNRKAQAAAIEFDLNVTCGIYDSNNNQTTWIPKTQHVGPFLIPAKSDADKIVRVLSAEPIHVTQISVLNLTEKTPNQSPVPPLPTVTPAANAPVAPAAAAARL